MGSCIICNIDYEQTGRNQKYCKECSKKQRRLLQNINGRKNYPKNKENRYKKVKENWDKYLEYQREWKKANYAKKKEEMAKLKREDRANNPEKYKKWAKLRYSKNPQYFIDMVSKYRETEQGKLTTQKVERKRRACKNNIVEEYTQEEWIQLRDSCNGICPNCKENKKLSLDHIYPISKANEDFIKTGIKRVYTIKDIQPLCVNCNSKKKDKKEDEHNEFSFGCKTK